MATAELKKKDEKMLFVYNGPVLVYERYVGNFKAETLATTKKKAESNLKYQFRQKFGYEPRVPVRFDGQIKERK